MDDGDILPTKKKINNHLENKQRSPPASLVHNLPTQVQTPLSVSQLDKNIIYNRKQLDQQQQQDEGEEDEERKELNRKIAQKERDRDRQQQQQQQQQNFSQSSQQTQQLKSQQQQQHRGKQLECNVGSIFVKMIVHSNNKTPLSDPITLPNVNSFKSTFSKVFARVQTSSNFDSLLDSLKEFFSDDYRLQLSLSPIETSSNDDRVYQNNFFTESFIKVLLDINCLQPLMIQCLFDVMIQSVAEEKNYIKQICSQLRWLDNITDRSSLTENFSTLLGVLSSNTDLKREIIAFIPDIIDDHCHVDFVKCLLEIYNNETELAVSVLDVLGNLNLNASHLIQVRSNVIANLNSSDLDDIPVMISFLLQTTPPKESLSTVKHIRINLNLFDDTLTTQHSTSKEPEQLIIESLKTGIRFKKELVNAFLKEISQSDKVKPLDIWILIIIYSFNQSSTSSKEIEMIFKKKISNGLLKTSILLNAVQGHQHGLKQFFNVMLSLCEYFTRTNTQPRVRMFGIYFYQLLFKLYRERYQQKDLIESLITHICSGNLLEANGGIEVLLHISNQPDSLDDLYEHSNLIKGILDQIDSLNEIQIRNIFKVFASLLYTGGHRSASIDHVHPLVQNTSISNEFEIFTRKQLTNSILKYKKIGLISNCAHIQRLSRSPRAPGVFSATKDILLSLTNNCKSSQIALAYLYDELVNSFRDQPFDVKIVSFVADQLQEDLLSKFNSNISNNDKDILWFGGEQSTDCIDIYPNILESGSSKEKLLSLSSHFRLLSTFVRSSQEDNSLENIEALLTCPIKMFRKDIFENNIQLSKEKELYCLALFHAINFIRELVNAFSTQLNDSLVSPHQDKVLKRIQDLVQLEEYFEIVLSSCTSFIMPYGTFDSDQKKNFVIDFKKLKKPGGEDGASSGSKQKQQQFHNDSSVEKQTIYEDSKPYLQLVKPYFRDFELSTLKIMQLYNRADIDSQIPCELVQIDFNSLNYLVQDLYSKLTILTTVEKVNPLLNNTNTTPSLPYTFVQFIDSVGQVFPSFLTYLERCTSLLESQSKELDSFVKKSKSFFKQLEELTNTAKDMEEEEEEEKQSEKEKKDKIKSLKEHLRVSNDKIHKLNQSQSTLHHCITLILRCFQKIFVYGDIMEESSDKFLALIKMIEKRKRSILHVSSTSDELNSLSILSSYLFGIFEKFIPKFLSTKSFKPCYSLLEVLVSLERNQWSGGEKNEKHEAIINTLSQIMLSIHWNDKIPTSQISFILSTWLDTHIPPQSYLITRRLFAFYSKYLEEKEKKIESPTKKSKKDNDTSDDDDHDDGDGDKNQETIFDYSQLINNQEFVKNIDFNASLTSTTSLTFLKCILSKMVKEFEPIFNLNNVVRVLEYSVNTFASIVKLIKYKDRNVFLVEILKQGMNYISLFSKHFIPYFKKNAKDDLKTFMVILKAVQEATRQLHSICAHGKKTKDNLITPLIPQAKKTFDTLNMDIKVALSNMGALNAFSTSNLSRQNLKGEIMKNEDDDDDDDGDDENSNQDEEEENDEDDDDIKDMIDDDIVESDEEMDDEEDYQKTKRLKKQKGTSSTSTSKTTTPSKRKRIIESDEEDENDDATAIDDDEDDIIASSPLSSD
ncbi:hypothetical protein CYY_008161 [Polysphondylium violaceum]|uniref:Fanconi anemia group D2 protein n=1 Tax=Polysphondylium violaceum TaxID=133409 RepID=A0A8J4UXI1_9MYCE|nr:hypothetical protein CYY_008161 [Polysphondylium violaceum]